MLKYKNLLILGCLSLLANFVTAQITVNITQVGEDVVAHYSGDLTGLTGGTQNWVSTQSTILKFDRGEYVFRHLVWNRNIYKNVLQGDLSNLFSGNVYDTSGIGSINSEGRGDSFGIWDSHLYMPGYYAGQTIAGSITWKGQTLESLNLVDNQTAVLTLNNGITDTITIRVGSAAVPEPSTYAITMALFTIGFVFIRKRNEN